MPRSHPHHGLNEEHSTAMETPEIQGGRPVFESTVRDSPNGPGSVGKDEPMAPDVSALIGLGSDQAAGMPFSSVLVMTAASLRSRVGRSMITLFGITLGVAFLMAVGMASLLRGSLSQEESLRTTAASMVAATASELGTLDARNLGIVIEHWDQLTRNFLEQLSDHDKLRLQLFAPNVSLPETLGTIVASRAEAAHQASALIICNHGAANASPIFPDDLRLQENVVMDIEGLYDPKVLSDQGLRYIDLQQAPPGSALGLGHGREEADGASRALWLIVVSLLVSGIGIANALLMSVTERFREIGTLKCLGALDRLVVQTFVIESGMLGLVGSILGVGVGGGITVIGNATTYGWATVWRQLPWQSSMTMGLASVGIGLVVAMVAAIYPAVIATRMMPSDALRTEV